MFEGAPESSDTAIHYHDEMELITVYDGEVICKIRDKEYTAVAGEVVFIDALVPHSVKRCDGSRVLHLQLREDDFKDNPNPADLYYAILYRSQILNPVKIFKNDAVFASADEIYREISAPKTATSVFIRSAVYKILGYLYRDEILYNAEEIAKVRDLSKVMPAIRYINENYVEDIALETVSGLIDFDPSYFCRVFRNTVGTTFTEYLNFVKICKAEERLLNTHDNIVTIARGVGFASVSYFNRIFKRFRNCSPKIYRSVVSLRNIM